MRTLMMLVSIALVGTGTFCIANASVAFASTAFVVGVVGCVVGAVELLVSRNTSINEDRGDKNFPVGGMILLLLGVVILSGAVAEELAITAVFAMIIARDGFIDIFSIGTDLENNTKDENIGLILGVLSVFFGIYMFYNPRLFNLPTQLMVGIVIILMGIRRLRISFQIRYSHQGFLSGNVEKLADAEREEKRALAKAKEGIRESKEAQRRIEKIKAEMEKDRRFRLDESFKEKMEESDRTGRTGRK